MQSIRMLEDAEGSPNGHTVHTYTSGDIYSRDSEPPVDDHLMTSFVISGRAVEVDAQGNPVGKSVDRRAYKAAHEPKPEPEVETDGTEDTGYNSPLEQKMRRSR